MIILTKKLALLQCPASPFSFLGGSKKRSEAALVNVKLCVLRALCFYPLC